MDNLLWLNSVVNIFVLFTMSALVSGRLWLARACFGPPDERCIVRRRERVVVVIPMYYYCGAHSHRVNIDIGIFS